MECTHCGKPAIVQIQSDEGAGAALCVDCNLKWEQAKALEFDRKARYLNKLRADLGQAFGMQFPMIAEHPLPDMGQYHMNNIRIDQSTIGVLNTGNIQTVDSAVTVLRGSDDSAAVGEAIEKLTQAVVDSQEASDEAKNEIIEILSMIAAEASAPEERRRGQAVKALLTTLSTTVSGIAALAQLWEQYGPPIRAYFGFA